MSGALVTPVHTVELVLRIARGYRWVREHGGQNRGEVIEHMLRSVGLRPGQPWCAAFVSMVGRTAFGEDWPLPNAGGCATLGEAAMRKEMLYQWPAPGAVFLLWSKAKGRFAHTGFVQRTTRHGWLTIEGNTEKEEEDGSLGDEGDGVYERERDFGKQDRFVYWWKP